MSVRLGFKAEDIIAEGRVTNHDINQINIWLREQNDLPIISEEEIVNFLLSNDNEQEGTKNTIKAFFKIRNETPDIFSNRLMSNETSLIEAMQAVAYFGIAPNRTADNYVVIHAQIYNPRYQSFNMALYCKFFYLAMDAAIYSSPPSGLIYVLDLVGFTLMHLTKFKFSVISAGFRYLQEALPVKLIKIHVLNTPYFIDKVLAIMKPFMSDHVRESMIFHQRGCNMDEFYEKCVDKSLLPKDIGGELPSMKHLTEQLSKNLKDMEPYFKAEEYRRSIVR